MLRFGILSTANIGSGAVVPALIDAEGCVVTAVASRDLARARAMAERFGIPHAFGSYDELLASDQIDAVYIPLPTSQHVEWTVKAARAGKHVLCEKPMLMKAEEIGAVRQAAKESGVVVSEAFMVTYAPLWHRVRGLLRVGTIGELRQVQGSFAYYNVDPDNMRNIPELGGGALPDIGVYPVVTTRFASGAEPKRVQASVTWDPKFRTDTHASVRADFGSFELSFYVSTQLAARQSMVFHGTEGTIEVRSPFNADRWGEEILEITDRKHGESKLLRFPDSRQYRQQAEVFAAAVRGEKAEIFTLDQSELNQKVIDACYRAAKHDGWETV